jgi:hypothetical protein
VRFACANLVQQVGIALVVSAGSKLPACKHHSANLGHLPVSFAATHMYWRCMLRFSKTAEGMEFSGGVSASQRARTVVWVIGLKKKEKQGRLRAQEK